MIELPSIEPGEGPVITFSVARELLPGESVTSCTVTAEALEGADPNAGSIIHGVADTASTPGAALQEIRPTIDGVTYLLRATFQIAPNGRTLKRKASIKVSSR